MTVSRCVSGSTEISGRLSCASSLPSLRPKARGSNGCTPTSHFSTMGGTETVDKGVETEGEMEDDEEEEGEREQGDDNEVMEGG